MTVSWESAFGQVLLRQQERMAQLSERAQRLVQLARNRAQEAEQGRSQEQGQPGWGDEQGRQVQVREANRPMDVQTRALMPASFSPPR